MSEITEIEQINTMIQALAGYQLGDRTDITIDQSPEEIGLDSLDFIELGMGIESEFGIELDDDKFDEFFKKPLGELATFVADSGVKIRQEETK